MSVSTNFCLNSFASCKIFTKSSFFKTCPKIFIWSLFHSLASSSNLSVFFTTVKNVSCGENKFIAQEKCKGISEDLF
jgi:hypothetical protein